MSKHERKKVSLQITFAIQLPQVVYKIRIFFWLTRVTNSAKQYYTP